MHEMRDAGTWIGMERYGLSLVVRRYLHHIILLQVDILIVRLKSFAYRTASWIQDRKAHRTLR